jgi:DoxX-like protein
VNVALWVAAIIAAAMSFGAAMNKLAVPKAKLAQQGMGMRWAEDFSSNQIKAIAAVEAVGAIGLILPEATGITEVLTPIAAVGLILLQFGAIATHLRRHEAAILPVNAVLVALLLFVAIGRFAG